VVAPAFSHLFPSDLNATTRDLEARDLPSLLLYKNQYGLRRDQMYARVMDNLRGYVIILRLLLLLLLLLDNIRGSPTREISQGCPPSHLKFNVKSLRLLVKQ
jgi:hypothetical protein